MSKPKKVATVRLKFADGRVMSLPMVDYQNQLVRQAAAMAASDSPELREDGNKLLREAARLAADGVMRQLQPRAAAKATRRNDPLRQRIVEMMRRERVNGAAFKTLMQRWVGEPINGLILYTHGDGYLVCDDVADDSKPYTWATLQKLYSA